MHTTFSITRLYESPIRANKTPYCQETTQPIGVPSYTTMDNDNDNDNDNEK